MVCAGELGTTQTHMTTKRDGTLGRGTSVLTGMGFAFFAVALALVVSAFVW
jgi:hypothetical protein